MGDFATLVTGPSGTGKELVAQAIAFSRYLPFDEKKVRFAEEASGAFHAVNLAALSPTLIESELFGHRRGAFTGAVEDRRGWLETCPPSGTVFLDEIGDLDPAIQVKLLRVIETRAFQPVGDTSSHRFEGKLIAATHRDLPAAMRDGRFREDLYYRLCADQIVTPPLREQLRESPAVLGEEAEELAREVEAWAGENLGPNYPWPGNYRELEQCVRNVLIRKQYRPPEPSAEHGAEEWIHEVQQGTLTADELLRHYAKRVYAMTGNYQETARRLQLDRRTVKTKVEDGSS
jgi:DNA-binding NtrC family response regulator